MNGETSRLDGVAKVTGKAKYGRDQHLQNAIYVSFVRCPWGNATLESFDDEAARKVAGVVEVEVSGKGGTYHGATVGHVAGDSPAAVERGLRALAVKWKRQPVKVGIEDAGAELRPELEKDAAAVVDGAEKKLEAVYTTQVQTHCCLETHGGCVDHRGDSAVAYMSTQGTFSARDGLDEAIGLKRSQYEVVCEYVGGGFGSKLNGAGKEGVLAAKIGAKYKRPAYVFCSREEDQTDTGNRPSGRALVRVGFKKDGTVLGGEIRTWGGTGVGKGGGGMAVPSGRYELGDLKRPHTDVQFNAGAPRAFRAPGHPQGAFVEELMLDEVAFACGVDPVELRTRILKGNTHKQMLAEGARLIGWEQRKATGTQTGVVRRGFGVGTATWGRFPAPAQCEVVINKDGSVEARTGTQDIGTGQRTTMGIVAAERVGVPLAMVNVRIGHSTLPVGPGSGGSVTSHNTAPAMASAADDAKKQFLEMVAKQAGGEAKEFEIKDGEILRGNEPFMRWGEACAKISGDSIVGRGKSTDRPFQPDTGSSDGAQFVDLEVDTETGVVRVKRVVAVQACGKVICRKTAESQVIGGVIQGVSYALFEDRVLDRVTGAMVNANLEMYKIAGTMDMPRIEPVLWTEGQVGIRSLGEPPTVPTAGAIACAVFNAIGKPVRHLPITPERVLAAMAGVEGGAA